MEHNARIRPANLLRKIAWYTLLVIGILLVLFALFSGAEDYRGGFKGILQNSPNAIPWACLLLLVGIAWKWELIGGILITTYGVFLVYFFNFSGPNFFWITFALTLLILLLGFVLLLSWCSRKQAP